MQTEKDIALARSRSGQRAWRTKNLCFVFVLLQMKRNIHWNMLMSLEENFGLLLSHFPGTRRRRETSPTCFFRYVHRALDDINWTVDKTEFDDLLALKKDSAPGPVGITYGAYSCAGGLGSKFLFYAYKALLEGSGIFDCFAESRTVFIPKTFDIDDFGRIIRSPDALRPLTLCNCDCKLFTSAICRGLHWYTMRCIHPHRDASHLGK